MGDGYGYALGGPRGGGGGYSQSMAPPRMAPMGGMGMVPMMPQPEPQVGQFGWLGLVKL